MLVVVMMTAAEYEKRKEIFMKELDFVIADVSLDPFLKFFFICQDNAFQVALGGTSYSLLQRIGAIARNGTKLFAVGTTASMDPLHVRPITHAIWLHGTKAWLNTFLATLYSGCARGNGVACPWLQHWTAFQLCFDKCAYKMIELLSSHFKCLYEKFVSFRDGYIFVNPAIFSTADSKAKTKLVLDRLREANMNEIVFIPYNPWFYLCLWYKDDPKSQEKFIYYLARLKSKALIRDIGSVSSLITRNSAKKISLALGQDNLFSRGFDKILFVLMASLRENSPILRAKALRAGDSKGFVKGGHGRKEAAGVQSGQSSQVLLHFNGLLRFKELL
ncbi:hypothetical protein IFM89_014044 [Coptis chinensis]|uniref:Uncharacterized protein n=1 Tax=Coptis chinensis TaxID=261450 RepID=A0A835LUZ9_9MAGN|nr:hypothetical protein IFM89_014044 [Coptis chinensis]